ncbi:MAG: HmuY family protein [Bacteroidota bacterium]
MKKQILLFTFLFTAGFLSAQTDFQLISVGAGYNLQSFVDISAGTENQSPNDAWDIAFNVGPGSAGVLINESGGSSMGQGLPTIELYDTGSDDFSMTPDPVVFEESQLHNLEQSWSSGAFNEVADPADPFDFGWGSYDVTNHTVSGSHVYVLKLRSGDYLKVQVQTLQSGTFTFRYANLDGSNEETKTIVKADHAGNALAYFSFASGSTVDIEPAGGFDLSYLRYKALLEDGGDPIHYPVTGILSGPGVEVVQADGVDPETVDFETYESELSAELDIIGHDWKDFDLGTFSWVLPADRAYFVKTADNNIWKIWFLDFEGSSTGTATIEKEDLGMLSAVVDENAPLESIDVFPNPVRTQAQLVFSIKNTFNNQVNLQISDSFGRLLSQTELQGVVQGLNSFNLPVDELASGMYYVTLIVDNQPFTERIVIFD